MHPFSAARLASLAIALLLTLFTFVSTAAEDLSATLQRGLFEEEANHDLNAAIKAYESVVTATDAQRKLAGTALYRLAECYRKLGRTNDAITCHQRVLREYPDQSRLVDLSREFLVNAAPAALGAARGSERTRLLERAVSDAQSEAIRLGALYRQLTNTTRLELRRSLPTVAPDPQLDALQDQRAKAEQRLAELLAQMSREHPSVKAAASTLETVSQQIDDRIGGILAGLKLRLELQQAQVAQLQKELQDLSAAPAAASSTLPAVSAASDAEEKEIRSIQSLVQDSPDLINARSHTVLIAGNNENSVTLLHKAAAQGQMKLAEFLLANGADVNAASAPPNTTAPGPTPLSLAARAGHKAMVELLLAKGARVQGATPITPLHEAASKGFKAIVETLLGAGADVNAEDTFQSTPLHEAAGRGFPGVAQVLIARGANPNALCRVRDQGISVSGNPNMVQFAGSALHQAALRGDKPMVDLLLTNKGNPNLRTHYGLSPLHVAVYYAQIPIAASLLAAGADINANAVDITSARTKHWAPLHFAIAANRADMVRFLLAQGADANRAFDVPGRQGGGGYTALHQLLDVQPKDFLAMIEMLFQHKANPNLTNANGFSPMFFAMRAGDKPELELLLKNGADPNLRDREGRTPLNQWETPRDIWETLLAHRADPNTQDKVGDTPLHRLANRARQARTVVFGPGSAPAGMPDAPDPNAPVALAQLLFEHGADANVRNASGHTALNIFGVPANPTTPDGVALVSVLRKHGAKDEISEPGPNPDSIRVWRKGRPSARVVFATDTGGHNRFTLFETILNFYKLTQMPPSQVPSPAPRVDPATGLPLPSGARPSRLTWGGNFSPVEDLPFPDFTRVRVQRFSNAETNEKKQFEFNLLNAGGDFDCAKDQLLEFGDVLILQEREFSLSEGKMGLTASQEQFLRNCLRCRVTFIVKGESKELDLGPSGYSYWFGRILQLSSVRSLLRSSSDLSRLTVRRTDPATKQAVEFKVDASDAARSALLPEDDLWLRDGDVIEVPDK